MAPHLKALANVRVESLNLTAKFNYIFIEYFYPDLKIIALIHEMFLRKMQIKSRPKPGFGMCVLTVAVMKTAKFFIQPEINLHGWSVLGMKMSFQLLADSIQFPLEGGFHGNFNIFQERPVDSSWQVTLCRSPRCGPLHLLCTSSQSRGRTALAASHDRITLSLYRSSHTNGLRLIEISLVLCCFHDRCCSLLVHS